MLEPHRRYTRTTLRTAVEAAGFEVERMHCFDALGVFPWFVAGRVLRQQSFDSGAARLYDRLAVPVCRRVEAVWPPRLGKTLVLVARRRSE